MAAPADMAARAASKFQMGAGMPAPSEPAPAGGEDPKVAVARDILTALGLPPDNAQGLADSLTEFYQYCKPNEM